MPKSETIAHGAGDNLVDVAVSPRRLGHEPSIVVTEITSGCLYSGFFGRLDSVRVQRAVDEILDSIAHTESAFIIVDLSNVDYIDSSVAAHLHRVGDALRLVGTEVVFCGISSAVSQTMVKAGVTFDRYVTLRDMKTALVHVLDKQGLVLGRAGRADTPA